MFECGGGRVRLRKNRLGPHPVGGLRVAVLEELRDVGLDCLVHVVGGELLVPVSSKLVAVERGGRCEGPLLAPTLCSAWIHARFLASASCFARSAFDLKSLWCRCGV